MSKLDSFIDKFFEKIKRRQADRIKKDFRKENPELAKELDKVEQEYQNLRDYLNRTSK